MNQIEEILFSGDKNKIKAFFDFDIQENNNKEILFKFNIWVRFFFPKQFFGEDALFHRQIDEGNLDVYRGDILSFVDIVFRGGAKTTRTKLFLAFCICCDKNHYRKYIKILSRDINSSKQMVTDIYNMLVNQRIICIYIDIFADDKDKRKREETMGSFTTSFGVKVLSGTVGTDQRGHVQGDEESSRPDFILFDDFETRKTLRSAVETKAIWDNMEEARTGLAKGGGCTYLCNYISERGNVHKLVMNAQDVDKTRLLIVPIEDEEGNPSWKIHTTEDIAYMRKTDDDFEGERMCRPSASMDVVFDRETLNNMKPQKPVEVSMGFKQYYHFNPSHRYGCGADVAGGVGLDSSADVIIDFSTIPARVVGTFASNTIKPDVYGSELKRHLLFFGSPIVAPENNKFDMCIGILKQEYSNIYQTEDKKINIGERPKKTFGWNTNRLTKPKMIFDLQRAISDGLIDLSDEMLILEAKSYTRDDLMDNEIDPRLSTRHFDLLTACAIAWQMKDFATVFPIEKKQVKVYRQNSDRLMFSGY